MALADRRAEPVSSYLPAGCRGNSLPVVGISALSRYLGHVEDDAVFVVVSGRFAIAADCPFEVSRLEAGTGHLPSRQVQCAATLYPANPQ